MRNKYYKQQLYKSTDGGFTWTAMDVYQKGAVYEVEGGDCQPQFRTVSGTPYCQDYDKYVTVTREISWDGGETWESASTHAQLVKHNSYDCGYPLPLTFVAQEDGRFRLIGNSINYSLDSGETWASLASEEYSPTVTSGSKIMWKATLTPTSDGIGFFQSTGRFTAEGNPMSLLYGDNYVGQTSLSGKDYAFNNLFLFCTKLTSAENLSLPATTLSYMCYVGMFQACTSLTTAPSLPATTLAEACYGDMFTDCTSLTTAPELLATTLVERCYSYMFNGCTSLTTAPELLATTLVRQCYQGMFFGCTNLNYIKCLATDISAEYCTAGWVNGVASAGTFIRDCNTQWSSGTSGIPNNWQDNCSQPTPSYENQYLTFIAQEDAQFKITWGVGAVQYSLDSGATWESLANEVNSPTVSAGNKIMWKATLTPSGYDGIGMFRSTANFIAEGNPMSLLFGDNFSGQTSLSGKDCAFMYLFYSNSNLTSIENLVLPATTLSNNCYRQMFKGCRSITTAPNLPATTLTSSCYSQMFMNCTNLNYIKCLATDISASSCTDNWVSGVASAGTFTKAASMTSWGSGNNGIPSGWTVVDA